MKEEKGTKNDKNRAFKEIITASTTVLNNIVVIVMSFERTCILPVVVLYCTIFYSCKYIDTKLYIPRTIKL